MSDYEDLLNKSWDEIPDPQNLPSGQWHVKGTNAALVKPREEGQSLKVLLTFRAVRPVNVAEDLLEEMGDYDFTANDLQYTQYIEGAADLAKLRKLLAKSFGIEVEGGIIDGNGKLSFAKAFRDAEAIAEIGERSYQDSNGNTVFQNTIGKFQAIEE